MTDQKTATITLTSGQAVTVVQSPTGAWDGEARCPVAGCTERAIHVRCYPAEVRQEDLGAGGVWEYAPAWCRGRHDAPIGVLRMRIVVVPGVLRPMGEGEPEIFRCRIY